MGCHHGSRSCPTLPSASNLPVAVTIVIAVICQNVSLNVNQVFGLDDTNTWRKRHGLHAVACFGRNFECHVIYRPQRWKSSCEISSHVNSRPAVATDNNNARYLTLQKPLERRVVSNHQELGCFFNSLLTHRGRDKMDAILQTIFSNAFSWMKMFEFRLKFHWSLFLRAQLIIFQHWFR